MPFSCSAEAQAESWIRTLRLHGRVGSAMQALGVGEAPLRAETTSSQPRPATRRPRATWPTESSRARTILRRRRRRPTGTAHLLGALFEVYGDVMERALELHGATRAELIQRLDEIGEHAEAS